MIQELLMSLSAFFYALPSEMHRLIAIQQVLCYDMTGMDMSNLASMFGGGQALGEFGGGSGVPPVQDPESAYASQLTQLQARSIFIS